MHNFLFYIIPVTLGFLCPPLLCMLCVSCLLPVSPKWYKRLLLFFACVLLSSMVIFVGDLVNLPPTICVFLAAVFFCCKGSGLKKLTLGLILSIAAFSSNALWDTYLFFPHTYLDRLIRISFWLLLAVLFKAAKLPRDFELSKPYWRLMLLLVFPPLGIILSVILLQYRLNDFPAYNMSNIALLFLSLFSLFGLFRAITVLVHQKELEDQQQLLTINLNYFQNLERQQFEIRRLRHDMANHLQVLSSLPPEKSKDYLQTLLKDDAFTSTVVFCPDDTINAILNAKLSLLKESDIAFEYSLSLNSVLPFSAVDVCALFANALDNAIEACKKLPADQRYIHLKVQSGKGLLVLEFQNPMNADALSTASLDGKYFFTTSKTDASHHGYGLKSIREVTGRLGGHMELTTENNIFCLFVYLPMSASSPS